MYGKRQTLRFLDVWRKLSRVGPKQKTTCILPFSIERNMYMRNVFRESLICCTCFMLEWVARATAIGDMQRVISRTVEFLSGSSKLTAGRSTCNYKLTMKHNLNSNRPTTIMTIHINFRPNVDFVTMCLMHIYRIGTPYLQCASSVVGFTGSHQVQVPNPRILNTIARYTN